MQTCAFAEASPKPKNPRPERPPYFLKRSKQVKIARKQAAAGNIIPKYFKAVGLTIGP